MRFFTGQYVPGDKNTGYAVYPNVMEKASCDYYVEKRVIRAAYGFKHIFQNVKRVDDTPIRDKIKAYLGSSSTYYRYMHGVLTLTPEQQEWIVSLFRQHGYTENLVFDNYVDRYDFG